MMSYAVNGRELENRRPGLSARSGFDDAVVPVIAAAEHHAERDSLEGRALPARRVPPSTATLNFATCSRAWPTSCRLRQQIALRPLPGRLAKQACKVAGLPQPLGKGGC